jgi:hypothetical protein
MLLLDINLLGAVNLRAFASEALRRLYLSVLDLGCEPLRERQEVYSQKNELFSGTFTREFPLSRFFSVTK